MRGTLLTARHTLLAVVVVALLATAVSWPCCDHSDTVGAGRTPAGATVVAATSKADACDDDAAPLAAAEPARTPLARPAAAEAAVAVGPRAGTGAVSPSNPDAARGDPFAPYALCVLRT